MTGNCSDEASRKTVNWAIGNVDKTTSMYGWQSQLAIFLTDDSNYGYDSSLTVNTSGDVL